MSNEKVDLRKEVRKVERCVLRGDAPCKVCQQGALWMMCAEPLQRYFELAKEQDLEAREIEFLEHLYALKDPRP